MVNDAMYNESNTPIVAVTGGALGIGGAVSRRFAADGYHVVLVDINEQASNETADQIRRDGGKVSVVIADVTTEAGIDCLAQGVEAVDGGRIDVLVNNVGDFRPTRRTFLRTEPQQWEAMHRINYWHVLAATHRLAPAMVEQGSGAIINVSTVEAFRGIPSNTVYSGYNAAVSAFTKSLAIELGSNGVRVNAVAPDLIDTPQTPADAMLNGRSPDMLASWIPVGHFGDPEDCANVIAFLASDQARFVTGHTVPVDGGTLAASGWYKKRDKTMWSNMPDEV